MNRYLEAYKARQCTVDDVLAAIRDRDFVATSGGVNAPLLFYKNIHKIAPRLKQGIDFFYGTTEKKGDFEFLESQACKGKIRTLCWRLFLFFRFLLPQAVQYCVYPYPFLHFLF